MPADAAVDPVAAALALVEAARWTDWRGLPPLTLTQLRARWTLTDAHGQGTLGVTPSRAEFRKATAPGLPRPVTVWSRGEAVVALEIQYPGEPAAFAELPKADMALDHSSGVRPHRAAADVHAARGLAVHWTADRKGVVRLVLFPAGPAETYRDTLHPHAQVGRRLPRRGPPSR